MRTLGRIALGLVLLLAVLVAVVLVRTFTFRAPAAADLASVKVAPAVAVDVDAAAQHLSQAVQIQTVSHQALAEDQPAEWQRLHDWSIPGKAPTRRSAPSC
jgi:carboxypeptidase PM20D1